MVITVRAPSSSAAVGPSLVSESSWVWMAASSCSAVWPGRAVATISNIEVSSADCCEAETSWAIFWS